MLQVSRKFEYGLHAVTYLATKGLGRVVTVKEMAEDIGFSPEFLSKAVQSLKRAGIANSVQGVKGGYMLCKTTRDISLADIAVAIEGKPHLVHCSRDVRSCEVYASCQHKGYMKKLQNTIQDLLEATTVDSLLHQMGRSNTET
ncbi:MAG: Rrf2 family transcriptional regulator [Chlorobium sp.]